MQATARRGVRALSSPSPQHRRAVLRLRVRWKLILAIGLPLLVLAGATGVVNYHELREDAFAQAEELLRAQASRYASVLDGQFRTMAQVSKSTASFVETHPDMAEEELYGLLGRNVGQDPLIYGACLAFEPYTFDPGKRLVAPYVYRGPEGLRRMDVGVDAYDYTEAKWDWYRIPKRTGQPFWTEPFFDEGAGNIVMCTYVTPIMRDGVFAGTSNIDVPLDKIQSQMQPPNLPGAQFFILTREERFVSHPDPDFIMKTSGNLAAALNRPDVAELGHDMAAGREGVRLFAGLTSTAGSHYIVYTPIRSAGWSVAVALPEAQVMAPVYEQLSRRVLVNLLSISLAISVLLVTAFWITRPIGRLAVAVAELGRGNMDARAEGVRARDEIGDLARGFNLMVGQLKSHVEALTRETAARQAVESELEVARKIQASLLPRAFPPGHVAVALHATNAAAKHVAGDFFDYFFVAPGTLMVVIADVSGKGVPAAMFMAVTRTVVRNLARTGAGPADLLNEANRLLGENNDEGMFVTLIVARYETASGRIVYANGGHPPPLRVDRGGVVAEFGAVTGSIVGVLSDQRYTQNEDLLNVGDRLVFYTDGVPDARDATGHFFGLEGLKRTLREHGGESAGAMCVRIEREVDDFQRHDLQDDVTVLVLERLA